MRHEGLFGLSRGQDLLCVFFQKRVAQGTGILKASPSAAFDFNVTWLRTHAEKYPMAFTVEINVTVIER